MLSKPYAIGGNDTILIPNHLITPNAVIIRLKSAELEEIARIAICDLNGSLIETEVYKDHQIWSARHQETEIYPIQLEFTDSDVQTQKVIVN